MISNTQLGPLHAISSRSGAFNQQELNSSKLVYYGSYQADASSL